MVMRESGSGSFWNEREYFRAEAAAYARKRMARRRARLQRMVLTGMILTAALLGFLVGRAGARPRMEPPAEFVTVERGDTLWTLAQRYGDPSLALLDRVDALAEANPHVASGRLLPGQRLRLP